MRVASKLLRTEGMPVASKLLLTERDVLAVALLLFCLAALGISQVIGPPPPPPTTVTVSPRVKGLAFVTDHQEASFACSINFGDPGYHIWSDTDDPTHAQGYGYTWGGLDFRGHQHDPSPTGYVTAAGGYSGSCTLKIVANIPGSMPFDIGPYSRTCFALGGPLYPTIQRGDSWLAPERDPITASYPPNYLQYFGYTFTGTKPSVYLQMPQTGMVAAGPQPNGTTYAWSVVGNAAFFPSSPLSTDPAVQISATDQSGTGSIHVKCTFHFDNNDPDDPVTGQADDDADSTPPPGSASAAPDYYHFTAHRPDETSYTRLVDQDTDTGPNQWGHQAVDQLFVQDHLGEAMPGCWVQERFPNLQSELQQNNPNGSILDLNTNGLDTWWTTGGLGAFGIEHPDRSWDIAQDGLSLLLPNASNPLTVKWQSGDHPDNPYWTIVQEFWGGTRNTQVSPEAAGVHIDNYTLKFWTDKILRTLTGF